MKTNRTAILLIAFSLLLPFASFAQKTNNQNSMNPSVNYEEFRLPNGLRVIMHEDRMTPIAQINVISNTT